MCPLPYTPGFQYIACFVLCFMEGSEALFWDGNQYILQTSEVYSTGLYVWERLCCYWNMGFK